MIDRIARHCVLLLTGLSLALPATAQDTASAVVNRLNDTLLAVMQEAGALGFAGRYERLEPVLIDVFAFPTMARVAAGSHWRTLSEGQRDRLADAFTRFSIATYANRFDGFSGELFEVDSEENSARGSMLVRSRIVTGGGETVSIDYLLRRRQGIWKIVDIYLDGTISELATKRSEYTAVLDDQGLDGLIARLNGRIADLRGNPG